jgi:hypothetical protein
MYIGLFKTDVISVQSSGILSPSSSVTGTATYKMTILYKQPTNDIAHNDGPNNGGYDGAVVPVVYENFETEFS